jgi:hypothetical protein
MKIQNVYNKLEVIAEMEEMWDYPDLIALRLIREGYFQETKHTHPDRLRTIADQVQFMRNIKAILQRNESKKP